MLFLTSSFFIFSATFDATSGEEEAENVFKLQKSQSAKQDSQLAD